MQSKRLMAVEIAANSADGSLVNRRSSFLAEQRCVREDRWVSPQMTGAAPPWSRDPGQLAMTMLDMNQPSTSFVVLCAVLAALGIWLATALVRVENQRYALETGLCQHKPGDLNVEMYRCLKKVETRTGWWWHLYYALMDE